MFANSRFGKKLLNGTLQLPLDRNLPNKLEKLSFYFIGDAAFPLKRNIMLPYSGTTLNAERQIYNDHLSNLVQPVKLFF